MSSSYENIDQKEVSLGKRNVSLLECQYRHCYCLFWI